MVHLLLGAGTGGSLTEYCPVAREGEMQNCKQCPSRMDGIFCDLSDSELDDLSSHKTTNRYKRGQKIFHEGNPPMGLFCISTGKVKLEKSGSEGNEIILRLYKPGDILGYRSLITGDPYGATAESMEESSICFVDRHFFTKLIAKEPELAFKMLRRLAHELSEAQDRIRDISNKTVRQRLGETILMLQSVHGIPQTDGDMLDIRLSRADLASMVNATPETVIRTLSDFQEEGFIKLDGKKIIVTDKTRLIEDAGLQY